MIYRLTNRESPANQIKVLKQQLAEAKIALSNLFIGTFAQILPYVNAFLMVIKDVAKAIATMLGIEVGDYNTSIATQESVYDDLGDSIGDVGSSADKAKKKVKELKREILGFDQINNINEPKDTGSTGSSGSGSSTGTGIDKRLLDAIKGYDNGMDKIRMKANEIKEKLEEWLGITDGSYTNLKRIWEVAKLIGKTILAWKVSKKVVDFFSKLTNQKTGKDFAKKLKQTAGLTIALVSLTYSYDAIKKTLKEGPNLANASEGILSAVGTGFGTYLLTGNVTASLAVTAIDLSIQAGVSLKKLWDEISPEIEENGGLWKSWTEGVGMAIDKGKNKLKEFKIELEKKVDEIGISLTGNEQDWKTWKKELGIGWNILTFDFGGLGKNFSSDFGKINGYVKENGGYWENWKGGVGTAFTKLKSSFSEKWNSSSFGKLNSAIKDNGGYWQSWKSGVGSVMDKLGVSKFFTKQYWSEKFNGIVKGGQEIIDKLKNVFSNFSAKIKTPHITWTSDGWKATGTVKKILDTLNLPTTLPKLNVKWYANGGLPSVGEMFVARENGPELVGKIGNSSAVVNNVQIIEGIKAGVYEAVATAISQYMGTQNSQIDVHVHTDEGTVVDRINQKTKQTGICPIDIPIY